MKKISLKNIKDALTRDEMRTVMAGSGRPGCDTTKVCGQNGQGKCAFWIGTGPLQSGCDCFVLNRNVGHLNC